MTRADHLTIMTIGPAGSGSLAQTVEELLAPPPVVALAPMQAASNEEASGLMRKVNDYLDTPLVRTELVEAKLASVLTAPVQTPLMDYEMSADAIADQLRRLRISDSDPHWESTVADDVVLQIPRLLGLPSDEAEEHLQRVLFETADQYLDSGLDDGRRRELESGLNGFVEELRGDNDAMAGKAWAILDGTGHRDSDELWAIFIAARSRLFDAWQWPWSITVFVGFLLLILVLSAIQLQRSARRARERTLQRLEALRMQRAGERNDGASPTWRQVEMMIAEVKAIHKGAFAGWSANPVFGALLLPFGGAGVLWLVELLTQVGF